MTLTTLLTIRSMEDRPLFSVGEVCALLNVKPATVYRKTKLFSI